MATQLIDGKLHVTVDPRLYNETTLYKCLYWYTGKYTIQIEKQNADAFRVVFSANENLQDEEVSEITSKFSSDLIDYKLRDLITRETQNIRELLIAKAFAHYDTDGHPHSVSDPVGFDAKTII